MTLGVIVVATTAGTPRFRSMNARTDRGQDRADENRLGDGRGQAEQPYGSDQDEAESYEEPAEQPESRSHMGAEKTRESALASI